MSEIKGLLRRVTFDVVVARKGDVWQAVGGPENGPQVTRVEDTSDGALAAVLEALAEELRRPAR